MSKYELNQQLWDVALDGRVALVEAALVAGADPDYRDVDPDQEGLVLGTCSVLQMAARRGNASVVALLLSHGAEPTPGGAYGLSPLHEAALQGNEAAVEALLENAKCLGQRSHNADTALFTALMTKNPYREGEPEVALKEHDPQLGLRLVRRLVTAGEDLNALNDLGESALLMAVRHQPPDVVKALIADGADVQVTTVFGTSLVAEGAARLNEAIAWGQATGRSIEARRERQQALDVLEVLHGAGLSLAKGPEAAELHYPSEAIQREIEALWEQWDQAAVRPEASVRSVGPR